MNELYHYGIKGQKWGVRNYQNADGSLTAEGRKRYRKEVKSENSEAHNYGADATVLGRGVRTSINRTARLQDKASRKLAKDPEALKKSTRRAMEKVEASERATLKITQDYKRMEKAAKNHCDHLMKKYGKENVNDIQYKDIKLSKSASQKLGKDKIKVVNENVNDLSDWATSGFATVASFAAAGALQLPVAFIFTPQGKNEQGYGVATDYYYNELYPGYR